MKTILQIVDRVLQEMAKEEFLMKVPDQVPQEMVDTIKVPSSDWTP